MFFDEAPIVSVNLNASNPHYGPSKNKHLRINRGDVVLIDMWAKLNDESAIYSDITWMGEVSETISSKVSERFLILRHAVDKAVVFLKSELKKRRVEGYEVDRLIRDEINKPFMGLILLIALVIASSMIYHLMVKELTSMIMNQKTQEQSLKTSLSH